MPTRELNQLQLTLHDLTDSARKKAIEGGLVNEKNFFEPVATIGTKGKRELELDLSPLPCKVVLKVLFEGEYVFVSDKIGFDAEWLGQQWFDRLYSYATGIEVSNFGNRPKYCVDLVVSKDGEDTVVRTLFMRNKNLYQFGL